MTRASRWQYVTTDAKRPSRSWTNVELAKFHYWNPNGLIAKALKSDERIHRLIEAGTVKPGWILAYGCFSGVFADNIRKYAMQRRVNPHKLRASIDCLEDAIERATVQCDAVEDVSEALS